MIDKYLKEKIQIKAYAIWKHRKEHNISGSALGDWLEAQREIFEKRQIKGCPICGYSLLAKENGKIICLRVGCNWTIETKRKTDENLPNFNEIKKEW